MGSLVTAAQTAYNEWKAANYPSDVSAWTSLTTEQALEIWKQDQVYQAGIADAQLIESSFYEARTAAFDAFNAQKQSEFVALQQSWQAKEDAGFDVDA